MNMKLDSFMKLYVEQLKDLYSAENQLTDALPKMADAASSRELQKAFREHLQVTREHVKRLEQVFEGMEFSPGGSKCEGMEGLIKEGEGLLKEKDEIDPDVLDAGLIAAAQRVEHYEIAGYGTVCTFARMLNRQDDAKILQKTLDDEYDADKTLTAIAERTVNLEAM